MPCPVGEGAIYGSVPAPSMAFFAKFRGKCGLGGEPWFVPVPPRSIRPGGLSSASRAARAARFRRTEPLPKQRTVRTRQAAMPPAGPSFLDFQRGPEASSRFAQDRQPKSPFKSCSEFFGAFSEGWPAEARRPVGVSAISFTAPDSSIPIVAKNRAAWIFLPKRGLTPCC
jgi:hypothetical protein